MNTTAKGLGRQWQLLAAQARTFYPPTCHICHKGINLNLAATDPKSWTLDHINSRALNGPKIPKLEETLPAHRDCNSRKGAGTAVKKRWEL